MSKRNDSYPLFFHTRKTPAKPQSKLLFAAACIVLAIPVALMVLVIVMSVIGKL